MKKAFVIHYGEIGIKGGNRDLFEKRLVLNIRARLKDLGIEGVRRKTGHITVEPGEASPEEIAKRLGWISGIEYFRETEIVEMTFEAISDAAKRAFEGATGTFRVTVKRADKRYPMTSQDLAAKLGEVLLDHAPGLKVDLHTPARECHVEIVDGRAFVGAKKTRGVGGLPVGSSGKLVTLISGGIDSPVASWMLAKRGAPLHFLHFHNFPYTDRRSMDIVRDVITTLNRNGGRATASFINLTPVQEEIVAKCDPRFRVLLYRRMMLRLGEKIAERERAGGFVTGESLGQVASQTVENIRAVEAVTALPILRPLIGMDKSEIVELAKRIGTYEASIREHADCCSLFVPKSPATKSWAGELEHEEAKLDPGTVAGAGVAALVAKALASEERVIIDEVTA